MRRFYSSFFFLFILVNECFSQDSLYAREIINTLCSKKFHGRGYVKQGDGKAAKFLASEFKKWKIAPVENKYYQSFNFPVNTFPGRMDVRIDQKKLIPGADFIVYPSSFSANTSYALEFVDSASLLSALSSPTNKCLVIDLKDFNATACSR